MLAIRFNVSVQFKKGVKSSWDFSTTQVILIGKTIIIITLVHLVGYVAQAILQIFEKLIYTEILEKLSTRN